MRRIVFALTLLSMSCAGGGYATRKECKDNCTGPHQTCKKIDGEYVCGVAWEEVAGSNGGTD